MYSEMRITGKVAIVTGGASGIGKGLCSRLLENGAKFVAILDFDPVNGQKAANEFSSKYGTERVKFYQCDVTNESILKNAFQEAYNVHETLDIVANNAGIISNDLRRTIDVNLVAVINGVFIAEKLITQQPRTEKGVIINSASMAVFKPTGLTNCSYNASKHGVVGLTKCFKVCRDGFSKDVRCNAVCPALVMTGLYTAGDYMTKELGEDIEANRNREISVDMVVDAFVRAIEDDDLNGALLKITTAGIEIDNS